MELTATMLEPLTQAITSNAGVILPVGITIMGILVAIGLIPKILYKFI